MATDTAIPPSGTSLKPRDHLQAFADAMQSWLLASAIGDPDSCNDAAARAERAIDLLIGQEGQVRSERLEGSAGVRFRHTLEMVTLWVG